VYEAIIKPGVRLTDLAPQMVLAYAICIPIFATYGIPCVITSVNDSKHSLLSWHYKGRAIDLRTKYLVLDGQEWLLKAKVKDALGNNYDVTLEDVGTENEHIHIEYDPKF
jgi:hypothetical protein